MSRPAGKTRQDSSALARLATRVGLEINWKDASGKAQQVPREILGVLLETMQLPCRTPAQLRQSLALLDAEAASRHLPPLITAQVERGIALPAAVVRAGTRYKVELEQGGTIDGMFSVPKGAAGLLAPIAEPGYHTLWVNDHASCLAVAPAQAFGPADARPGGRAGAPAWWSLAVQVYGLRERAGQGGSGGGIGTYTTLADAAKASAAHGAQALAISPVHAMFSAQPEKCSPYSPSSRLFLNALHIDPAAVFGAPAAQAAAAALGLAGELARLDALELIDWPRAGAARLAILRYLFDAFANHELPHDTPRARAFAVFRAQGGKALADHAQFEALHAHLLAQSGAGAHWRDWPADLQDPASPAVAAFAAEHAHEVSFHVFLQWLADQGLAHAQQTAREAGMALGLIADLAVGCDSAGSHAWSYRNSMLQGASVGAPPDLFNPAGQSWGLTTFSPRAMKTQGFGAFIAMLRAAFAHAGGVRIDHILGLRRLWLVPEGEPARRGAYLHYPSDDLLRLIALESWRHRAIVIGEDLGTVPAGFREQLADSGLLGIRVLWFEQDRVRGTGKNKAGTAAKAAAARDPEIFFKPPRTWDAAVAATITTHDLPTVTGWWRGSDIDWRARVGQIVLEPGVDAAPEPGDAAGADAGTATAPGAGTVPEATAPSAPGIAPVAPAAALAATTAPASGPVPSAAPATLIEQALATAHAAREQERQALWRAFEQAGVASPGSAPPRDAAPVDEALAFVGMTPAPLVTYPLEDLLGLADQPNLPGSIDEHPNWRRRMTAGVAELFDDAAIARRLLAIRTRRPGDAS